MIIARGAEATLVRTDAGVRKERPAKRYRHPHIDEHLRTARTRSEARILSKARAAGVPTPRCEMLDGTTLLLEDIPGVTVAEALDADPGIAARIGEAIAALHDADLTHGDPTTSNMIADDGKITLIDFGLAQHSKRIEDKAVDLHVLKQSFLSRHHKVQEQAWDAFLQGYRPQQRDAILARLHVVERRGRNKGS